MIPRQRRASRQIKVRPREPWRRQVNPPMRRVRVLSLQLNDENWDDPALKGERSAPRGRQAESGGPLSGSRGRGDEGACALQMPPAIIDFRSEYHADQPAAVSSRDAGQA